MAMAERQTREPEAAEINPIYLELAFRAAGLRVRSGAMGDGARVDAVLAPGEIDPGLRRDRPLMERKHAAPMGSPAPQASLIGGGAGFSEVSRTDPMQRASPGMDRGS
jgi:hypothetical protein